MNLFKCALAIVLAGSVGVVRADQKIATLRSALSKVPTAEVPVKAAELVSRTKTADRDGIAVEVVKIVFKAHPTITVATVGLVSSKCPETAPTAAATTANLQPKQVKLIAKAAAAAAPSQAGAIVKAVCKVVPTYREVALAVAEAVPGATMEILDALGEVMPNMKTRLDVAIASYHGNVPSVAAVLYRANPGDSPGPSGSPVAPLASTGLRGPSVGAPYIPLLVAPSYVPPGGGIVPPGGRDYAAP